LGFDVRQKLKVLAITEERARLGLVVAKPPPVLAAPEITEADIRRACASLSALVAPT